MLVVYSHLVSMSCSSCDREARLLEVGGLLPGEAKKEPLYDLVTFTGTHVRCSRWLPSPILMGGRVSS